MISLNILFVISTLVTMKISLITAQLGKVELALEDVTAIQETVMKGNAVISNVIKTLTTISVLETISKSVPQQ